MARFLIESKESMAPGSKQFAALCLLLFDVIVCFGPIMVSQMHTRASQANQKLSAAFAQAVYGVLVEILAYCNVLVKGNRFECDTQQVPDSACESSSFFSFRKSRTTSEKDTSEPGTRQANLVSFTHAFAFDPCILRHLTVRFSTISGTSLALSDTH